MFGELVGSRLTQPQLEAYKRIASRKSGSQCLVRKKWQLLRRGRENSDSSSDT